MLRIIKPPFHAGVGLDSLAKGGGQRVIIVVLGIKSPIYTD